MKHASNLILSVVLLISLLASLFIYSDISPMSQGIVIGLSIGSLILFFVNLNNYISLRKNLTSYTERDYTERDYTERD